MKVAAILVCVITLVFGEEIKLNQNGCPIDFKIDRLYKHADCNKYYQCIHGNRIERMCPGGLLFNVKNNVCDWPNNVECEKEVEEESKPSDNSSGDNNNGNDENIRSSCNCVPDEAPAICARAGSHGILIAHEHCNKFYQCSHGRNISISCPAGLLYNPYLGLCDYPYNVNCGDRVIPDPEDDKPDKEEEDDNNGGDDNGTCNCVPGEAPAICAKDRSDGILIAHEHCNKFYKCAHGRNISMLCPVGLLYNPYKEVCDYPKNVNCGDRIIPDPEDDKPDKEDEDDNNGGDDNVTCNCDPSEAPEICARDRSDGVLIAHEQCNKFYQCSHGRNISVSCPAGLLYNPYKKWCDFPVNVECGDRINPDEDNETCNCVPDEARDICTKDGSNGILIAHEHCDKFYTCSDGKNVTLSCPSGLLFNPYKRQCDNPINVKCGDRIVPKPDDKPDNEDQNCDGNNENNDNNGGNDNGNGDNDNGSCNCDPGEAPAICARDGSDGVLVAHEHCDKFYKCSHGKNVTLSCPEGLLYNPYKKWCDYPNNVKCGDRIIPNPDDKPDNEDQDCDGNNENNDNNDNGNGDNDNGSCNCDPGEAPAICARDGSDGVLVAHEHCDKFYKCSHGKNVTLSCPEGLLYNPYKKWCDYPNNVKCGDRIIPNPDDKPDNEDQDCDGNNENNDNNDNGNGDNDNGSCNCDPGEAPAICARDGSDGVLVAHEHCDKFYKCSHGKNVTLSCPEGLLYNPYKKWCDYPNNVKCGDRIIPKPDDNPNNDDQNCDNNNENDDNKSDNDSGNGDKNNCNCNPDEAPAICARPGSHGWLIAHEHCNKFYQCSHGRNVTIRCPAGLLYNPYKELCDYPDNVDCGDRVIPDPEDDKPDKEDEDDNNGGDDNGSCNCVPGEAPEICARDGSDGILIAHEHCNKFYKCSHGKNISMPCPVELLYNPYKEVCDYPENVNCGDRIIPDPEDDKPDKEDEDDNNGDDDNGTCNCDPSEAPEICARDGSDGVLIAHEQCNKFYKCSHGKNISVTCPAGLLYNPYKKWCDYPENVECGDRINPDQDNDSCNCDPDEARDICSRDGSNGKLIVHEHCDKFYKCIDGKNVTLSCSAGLLFNPCKNECDKPDNVKCGDRIVPKPDDEDENCDDNNGNDEDDKDNCNCNPDEAPAICARPGSHGMLIAHEHCNKFYQCSHGRNVTIRCPAGLLYNPYLGLCDYPYNVKCGDRVIPDPEDDKPDKEDEDDNNGGDDNGTCNCVPGEAPAICAKDGSDGILIAHEHCNKFYKCAHGRNISMPCPVGLLYNPYKEVCDYPQNINCGDRIIPDPEDDKPDKEDEDDNNGDDDNGTCNCDPSEAPEICARDGSDGVLIAHEYCNKFYQCSHGRNISVSCPPGLLYNPYKKWCDFPVNVECGDRINPNEDNEPCNCSRFHAVMTCEGESTNGLIVAHEKCNQFYSCSNGQPIELICPPNLLFNSKDQICDWPRNVVCGERIF